VMNLPHMFTQTLDAGAAKRFLAGLVLERLRSDLTNREGDVLREAVRRDTFTNAEIARSLQGKPPNVTKYLDVLLEKRLIYPYRREGRQVFYRASEDVRIMRDFPDEARQVLSG